MSQQTDLADWVGGVSPGGSNILAVNQAVAGGNTYNSAILDVTPFQQLLFGSNATGIGVSGTYTITWYQDKAGTIPLSFPLTFHNALQTPRYATIPVLGPFVKFTYVNGGANATFTLNVEGVTQSVRLKMSDLLGNTQVLDYQAVNIAAGTTSDLTPQTMVAGPAVLWVNGVATIAARLLRWNGTAYDFAGGIAVPAAQLDAMASIYLPMDDWQIAATNPTAGPVSVYCSVVAQ